MAKIKYGEKTLAEITTGQTLTLHLEGHEMEHDIEIEGFASAEGGGSGGGGTGGDMICTLADPTIIGVSAFASSSDLTSVYLPKATSIGVSAFAICKALTSIDLPNATSIGGRAFNECAGLTSIYLPLVTSIGSGAFYGCTSLFLVNAPLVTSVDAIAFYGCTALTLLDLPLATSIGDSAIQDSTSFDTLILRNTETVCNLMVSALFGTKILTAEGMPTGEGFVYVPTALYDSYVTSLVEQVMLGGHDEATATYLVTAVLRKIEDYPEICG